jgi:hypothetical protein
MRRTARANCVSSLSSDAVDRHHFGQKYCVQCRKKYTSRSVWFERHEIACEGYHYYNYIEMGRRERTRNIPRMRVIVVCKFNGGYFWDYGVFYWKARNIACLNNNVPLFQVRPKTHHQKRHYFRMSLFGWNLFNWILSHTYVLIELYNFNIFI